MNKCSGDCVYDYYEFDTNYGECQHPDFDPEKPDRGLGYWMNDCGVISVFKKVEKEAEIRKRLGLDKL